MSVSDLVIIYLAIGAPFGVYHIATDAGEQIASNFAAILISILLWPLTGLFWVFSRYSGRLEKASDPLAITAEMEKIASRSKTSSVFEFREVLSRYVGLSAALEAPIGTRAIESLAEIGCISNKETAKACFKRLNRARLDSQHSVSREDFIAVLAAIAVADPQILRYAVTLSRPLGDHEGADQIEQRAVQLQNTDVQTSSSSKAVSLAA